MTIIELIIEVDRQKAEIESLKAERDNVSHMVAHERLTVATLRAELDRLKAELAEARELHIMQLAAISTASIQNTESSKKDRIGSDNSYYSCAYQDTCVAVDREMSLRAQLSTANRALEEIMKHAGNMVSAIHGANYHGPVCPPNVTKAMEDYIWWKKHAEGI